MDSRIHWPGLLVFILSLLPANGNFTGNELDTNLVRILSKSIENDFRLYKDSFIMQYYGLSKESQRNLEDIANNILRRSSAVIWHLGSWDTSQTSYKVNNVIILIDSYESLRKVINDGNMSSIFGFDVKCLVVLLTSRNDSIEDTMERIFHYLNRMFVLKAVIAVPQEYPNPQDISFFTYFPYEAGECGSTRPKFMGTYRDADDLGEFSTLFRPLKMNLNGCPLKVVITEMSTFMQFTYNNNSEVFAFGVDAEHVKVLSEKINFSPQFSVEQKHGTLLANGTTTGIFNKLQTKQADFSISGMSYFPPRLRVLSGSQPYYSGSVFIALEADIEPHAIDSTLRPFQLSVWIVLITMYALRFIFRGLFKMHQTLHVPRTFRRFMVAMWLIVTFYYRIFYDSVYYSLMQNPPDQPIPRTLHEMSQQGYTVLADHSTSGFFEDFRDFNDTVRRVALRPLLAYNEINHQHKIALATKAEHFASYMAKYPERRKSFVIVPEVLFLDHFCIYFPPNSYLKKWFDDVIAQIVAAGLISNYLQKYIGSVDRYLKSSLEVLHQESGSDIHSISLSHLRSLFFLYSIGMGLGIVLFCLEHFSLRVSFIRKIIELV